MKLNEITHTRVTESDIRYWIKENCYATVNNFTINADNSISFLADFTIRNREIDYIPFKIDTVKTIFDIGVCRFTNMTNFPSVIGTDAYMHNNQFTSLEGLPKRIGGTLDLTYNPIQSLVNTHDIFDECFISDTLFLDWKKVKSGGLSLIFIKGIGKGLDKLNELIGPKMRCPDGNFKSPWNIIDKYIGNSDDIFECQNELIENGFEEYAQL